MNHPKEPKLHVERHLIDPTQIREIFPERCQKLQKVLATQPTKINSFALLASVSEAVLEYAAVLEPDNPMTHESARAFAQGETGVLVLGCAPENSEAELPFGNRKVTLPASPTYRANLGTWTYGFYAALMARDTESLALLSGISEERLSASAFDFYNLTWKEALLRFRSDPDPESALAAIETTALLLQPEKVKISSLEAAAVSRALCPMLEAIVRRDGPAFNEALVAALEAHKALWGTESEAQLDEGWVAWGPLALSCLAHDRELPVRVESGYLLPYLIERRHPSLSR